MAGQQKNTNLAAYNQQNSSKYSTSQKYSMEQKKKKRKKTNRQRTRQRATYIILKFIHHCIAIP